LADAENKCRKALKVLFGASSGEIVSEILKTDLYDWCRIPAQQLVNHPQLKVPFRMVANSGEMGRLMTSLLKLQRTCPGLVQCFGVTCK
jgi:hypothetical protein